MNDYKERFEKWQREAKERFDDFDKQIGLKEKIEKGAEVLKDTAQKSAEVIKEGAEKIKSEAEKSEVGKQAVGVAEGAFKTAGETAKKVYDASAPVRDAASEAGGRVAEAAKEAGKKAGEVFDDASEKFNKTAKTATGIFNFGASWTRTFDSTWKTLQNASEWVAEKPLQAAATGVSVAVGAVAGVVFTGISSHWLFNSMIPTWSVKKAAELFNDYLKTQEKLITEGDISKAEAEKIQFERDIAKYVGAPLLGAFSFASGAVMMTNIVNPKTITGAPLDWLIGGNPLLEGVWFFGNGMVCFKTSYDFFMIALEDHEDVQKIVREVKGMLPQATE